MGEDVKGVGVHGWMEENMHDGSGAEHCWMEEEMQDGGGVDEWQHRFLEYLWGGRC